MADLFRLDKWIPDNPTEDDFKSKFSETWDYPSKKDRLKISKKLSWKTFVQSHPQYCKLKGQRYRAKYPEKERQRHKIYRLNNLEKLNKAQAKWRELNKEKRLETQIRYNKKRKLLVISHYSNNLNNCKNCGSSDFDILTVDHINGGGCKHKKEIGNNHIYQWLIKNNFPDGFQILCMGCNWKKRFINKEFYPNKTHN